MPRTRRTVLRRLTGVTGLGILGLKATTASVAARNQSVSGRVQRPDNKPADRDQIHIEPGGNITTTNEGGFFSEDLGQLYGIDVPDHLFVGYYQVAEGEAGTGRPARDGTPDVAFLEAVEVRRGPIHLGNVRLETAHVLNVRVEDDNGDPVEGVRVSVNHGGFRYTRDTNENGLFAFDILDEPGVELPDTNESGIPIVIEGEVPTRTVSLTDDQTELFIV